MVSSGTPASAASRICARFSLRAARLPPPSRAWSAPRSASLSSTRSRMFIRAPLPGEARTNGLRRMPPAGASFTDRQGQYLAFIHAYARVHGRPPAEADMQRHFRVSPPSVHQMVLTLERAGLIRRKPGLARSIEVLVEAERLPVLRSRQPVKSSVQGN